MKWRPALVKTKRLLPWSLRKWLRETGRRFGREAGGVYGFKLASVGLGVSNTVFLTNVLSSAEFGIYATIVAGSAIAAVVCGFGQDTFLARRLSEARAHQDSGLLKAALLFSGLLLGFTSVVVILAAVTIVVADGSTDLLGTTSAPEVLYAAGLVVGTATVSAIQGAIQGMNRPVRSRVPTLVIIPASMLVIIVLAWWLIPTFDSRSALLARTLATWVGVVAGASFLVLQVGGRDIWSELTNGTHRPVPIYQWLRSGTAYMAVAVGATIQRRVPVVVSGVLLSSSAAGVFEICRRIVAFLEFILSAIGVSVVPRIAELAAKGKYELIGRLNRRVARTAGVLSFLAGGVILAFSTPILSVFDVTDATAVTVLSILIVGQAISTLAGVPDAILNMTGNEDAAATVVVGGAILTLVATFIGTVSGGPFGLALGTAMAYVSWRAALILAVRWRLGIITTDAL